MEIFKYRVKHIRHEDAARVGHIEHEVDSRDPETDDGRRWSCSVFIKNTGAVAVAVAVVVEEIRRKTRCRVERERDVEFDVTRTRAAEQNVKRGDYGYI